MSAWQNIIAKVEAETANAEAFKTLFPNRTEHWDEDPAAHAFAAYLGSLDAAKALHETVLPADHQWVVGSFRDGKRSVTFSGGMDEPNPARAWLIAILRTLDTEPPDAP